MADQIVSDTGKTIEEYRAIIKKLKKRLNKYEFEKDSLQKTLKSLKS